MEGAERAAKIALATRGIPATGRAFFRGTPLEPPLAGMIAHADLEGFFINAFRYMEDPNKNQKESWNVKAVPFILVLSSIIPVEI